MLVILGDQVFLAMATKIMVIVTKVMVTQVTVLDIQVMVSDTPVTAIQAMVMDGMVIMVVDTEIVNHRYSQHT